MKPLTLASAFLLLCASGAYAQQVGFSTPDTVCVNTPLPITNTSVGGSTWYWNFCVSNIDANPVPTNLGNVGGNLSTPVFIDFAEDNGTYYGYVTNNYPGGLVQLNFGNSLLNNPTSYNYGDLNGTLYNTTEGIQLEQENGSWYAIIVGGTPLSGGVSSVTRVNFGSSLGNTNPTSTNWGNPGNLLSEPISLRIVKENGNWYGFTANSTGNTITRLDFGPSIASQPVGVDLGNPGNLSYPTGIDVIQSGGNWFMFLVSQLNSSIVRLDFGNSILNTPVATNLGNPSGALNQPRDISVIQFCGSAVGFVTNAGDNSISRLDFPGGFQSSNVTGTNLGNQGNLSFPHSLSTLFQEGADMYTFVPNVDNNTITRFEFNGCDNSAIPPSQAFSPGSVTYTTPGIYNINLQMDVGLPSQSSTCKSVVVLPPPQLYLPADTTACGGDSILLSVAPYPGAVYTWNTGSDSNSTVIKTPGSYSVGINDYGCTTNASTVGAFLPQPAVSLPPDTSFCDSGRLGFESAVPVSYTWSTGSVTDSTTVQASGIVRLTVNDGVCSATDSTLVTVNATPKTTPAGDSSFCGPGMLRYDAPPGITLDWVFTPSAGGSPTVISQGASAAVTETGWYTLVLDNQGCVARDSTLCTLLQVPAVNLGPDTAMCLLTPYLLSPGNDPGGYTYRWQNGSTLPVYEVFGPGLYSVTVSSGKCQATDSIYISKILLPHFTIGGDRPICPGELIYLQPGQDSLSYVWQNGSTDTVFKAVGPGAYSVTGSNVCGSYMDSITIYEGICVVHVPSAFTPNGDGVNDLFRVLGVEVVDHFDLDIFDRYGKKLFETRDPYGAWDGTYNGVPQPTGAYVYELHFRYAITGASYMFKGTVTLLR